MKAIIVLLVVCVLVGCSPKLTVGIVTAEVHEEAREWRGRKCDDESCWDGTYYDDEDYVLTIRGGGNQEGIEDTWYVSLYWYEIAEVGRGLSFHSDEMSAYDFHEFEDD